jgi:hypothetical protein
LTADSLEGRTTTRLTLWLYRDRGGRPGNLLVRSALRMGRTTREARTMIYKTLEGVLNPDGRVILPREELPEHSVRVIVTILENGEEAALSEVGDYLDRLTDYEERLAQGKIQWQ